MFKRFIILALLAVPVAAQEVEEKPADKLMRLFDQLSTDAQDFFGLMAQEFGPALEELRDKIEDWSYYEKPEILPNGDIIIRRKPEHPVTDGPVTEL